MLYALFVLYLHLCTVERLNSCGSACAALCGLVMWSFLQLILGSYLGPASRTIFALLGAIVFSAYIVLDTENLIAKHDLDDYVAASLSLYLVSVLTPASFGAC